jgi:hypothetical protein
VLGLPFPRRQLEKIQHLGECCPCLVRQRGHLFRMARKGGRVNIHLVCAESLVVTLGHSIADRSNEYGWVAGLVDLPQGCWGGSAVSRNKITRSDT